MIQFGGVYELVGVRHKDGSTLTDELKDQAVRTYFWSPSKDFPLRGRSGGYGTAGGTSKQYYSFPKGDKLFLAIDDEAGNHGTETNKKIDKLREPSNGFWNSATQGTII